MLERFCDAAGDWVAVKYIALGEPSPHVEGLERSDEFLCLMEVCVAI